LPFHDRPTTLQAYPSLSLLFPNPAPTQQDDLCLAGHPNLCREIVFAGHANCDGGLQRYLAWPTDRLHLLPDSLSDADGAMLEPLAYDVIYGAFYSVRWYNNNSYYVKAHNNELVIYQGRIGGFLWYHPVVVENTGVRARGR